MKKRIFSVLTALIVAIALCGVASAAPAAGGLGLSVVLGSGENATLSEAHYNGIIKYLVDRGDIQIVGGRIVLLRPISGALDLVFGDGTSFTLQFTMNGEPVAANVTIPAGTSSSEGALPEQFAAAVDVIETVVEREAMAAEAATAPATEAPTEPETEPETAPATDPTEAPTQAPTEAPTEATDPTEPTTAATEPTTTAATEPTTTAATEPTTTAATEPTTTAATEPTTTAATEPTTTAATEPTTTAATEPTTTAATEPTTAAPTGDSGTGDTEPAE